jgi:hypothetical protein
MTTPKGIDPRGPRFTASITAVSLAAVVALGIGSAAAVSSLSFTERATQPSFIIFATLVVIFAWSATQGVAKHPFGLFFKAFIRPRLAPPTELENAVPPTFAQGVGFVITVVGAILHLTGVPYALVIAASAAFIAAFLNAVFAYCLGCQIYLVLVRLGVLGRNASKDAATA